MNPTNNILICPLEWGLGHAARMIPLARLLQEMNNNIIIGAGKEHQALFREEMTGLSYINFPGFKPVYSRIMPQYIALLLKIPNLIYHIIREHFKLKRIIREHDIDIVISDNRFGLWNKKTTTVYVTHQLLIPFPKPFRFLEFIGVRLHSSIIRKYSFCFIPDLPGDMNISGRLSHGIKLPKNVRYTGILSRFIPNRSSIPDKPTKFKHTTVILSGPEPQKGILRQKLISVLKDKETITIILEGKPGNVNNAPGIDNFILYNHLSTSKMEEIIKTSERIISRAGYTTIMDLISLNCKALLIPTPGQPEQEYLAEYLSEKGWFSAISQSDLKENHIIVANETLWSNELVDKSITLLSEALKELLEKQHEKK